MICLKKIGSNWLENEENGFIGGISIVLWLGASNKQNDLQGAKSSIHSDFQWLHDQRALGMRAAEEHR